jgi:hypothetical protein
VFTLSGFTEPGDELSVEEIIEDFSKTTSY